MYCRGHGTHKRRSARGGGFACDKVDSPGLDHVGLKRMTMDKEATGENSKVKTEYTEMKRACELGGGGGRKVGSEELCIKETEPGRHFSADVGHLAQKTRKANYKFLVFTDNAGGYVKVYPIKSDRSSVYSGIM